MSSVKLVFMQIKQNIQSHYGSKNLSPANSDGETHAVQHTPAGWLQENRAQLNTKFLWAVVFLEYDHHQRSWKNNIKDEAREREEEFQHIY